MQLKYNIWVLTNKTSVSFYFASITTLISKFTALNNSIPTLVYALSPQADPTGNYGNFGNLEQARRYNLKFQIFGKLIRDMIAMNAQQKF